MTAHLTEQDYRCSRSTASDFVEDFAIFYHCGSS